MFSILKGGELDLGTALTLGENRTFDKVEPGIVHAQVNLVELTVSRRIIVALDPRREPCPILDGILNALQAIRRPVWIYF